MLTKMHKTVDGKQRRLLLDDFDIPSRVDRAYRTKGAADWIGVQKEDTKPILYLSGTPGAKGWNEDRFWRNTGCRYRCFSYAYCGYSSPLIQKRYVEATAWCLRHGVRVFLDSGAHTFHRMKDRGSTLVRQFARHKQEQAARSLMEEFFINYARYVRLCYKEGMHFDFYVTFDAEKECPKIWEWTKRLSEEQNIWSVPVYHGDASINWVKRYIDEGHKLIGVGIQRIGKRSRTAVYRYYDAVFDLCEKHKVKCHGFAVTGDIMFAFPWYSVDSTTWVKLGGYGKIIGGWNTGRRRVGTIHVSSQYSVKTGYGHLDNLSPVAVESVREEVASCGYDLEELRRSGGLRSEYNARAFVALVREHTKQPVQWERWSSIV